MKSSKSVLSRLLEYTKPYKLFLITAIISAIISVIFSLLVPVFIGQAVDLIVGKGNVNFAQLPPILIRLAVTVVASAIFLWIMTFCTNRITYNTVKDIRNDIYRKLNIVPLIYSDRTPHGDIISRIINDVDQISDGLLQGFSQLLTGIVTILGTIVFMLSINVKLGLVVILITPLSLFVAWFITKISHGMFREQAKVKGEIGACVDELIGNQKVVKAFSHEDKSQAKFEEINARLYKCGVKAQFYSALTNPTTRFVNGIVYAAVGVFGAISIVNGSTDAVSVGEIATFLNYANQYTKPFNEITGVITELQYAFSSARRVFAVLDEETEISDNDNMTLNECNGSVTISDVDFCYNPEVPLIENLNLDIKPGQRIAIVGPTGCGKTTLINLLMRFYDVKAGSIKTSGIDIRKLKRDNLRSMYGMVMQETWIFTGTVKENIAYGCPDATDEEIIQAAKMAHAHSFIKRLPDGYNTIVSENGGVLSQGQKQLLSIARIMLTSPPMLILDEATSSIDTMTEQRIQKAFAKLMKGRTSFIIAHRLSTIKDADIILVMKSGHIIEQGSHEELLTNKGFYADLYNSQFEQAAG